jgi:hypothetical protein
VAEDLLKRNDVFSLRHVVARELVLEIVHCQPFYDREFRRPLHLSPEVNGPQPLVLVGKNELAIPLLRLLPKDCLHPGIDGDVPHLPVLGLPAHFFFDPYHLLSRSTSYHFSATTSLTRMPV